MSGEVDALYTQGNGMRVYVEKEKRREYGTLERREKLDKQRGE